jgi:hypothetical protein
MIETHSLYEVKGEGKGQGKVHLITGHEGPEVEQRYSSTLSLTSALNGVGVQRYASTVVGPRAGLHGCGKSRPTTGIRSPYCPSRSELLV